MIYLDYASSTPVDKKVLDKYNEITINNFANPNSMHKLGLESKKIINECIKNISNNLNVSPEEVIFTSGATETNNMVIKGICERYKNKGKHIIISSLEHNSIVSSATRMQEQGFEVSVVNIKKDGTIDIDELKSLIRKDTILVSICTIDSELGIRQPIEEIAEFLKKYENIVFHTDASQAYGKTKLDLSNIDLVTIAPHKFYGLTGIGILIKKKKIMLKPLIDGGKSTTVYRSGTPDLNLIASADVALDLTLKEYEKRTEYVTKLKDLLINEINKLKKITINSTDKSVPYIINISIKDEKGLSMVEKLEKYEIYVSSKTSCCPVSTPSKLVYALTKDKSLSQTSLRISLSHLTTREEIEYFIKTLKKIIEED